MADSLHSIGENQPSATHVLVRGSKCLRLELRKQTTPLLRRRGATSPDPVPSVLGVYREPSLARGGHCLSSKLKALDGP